MPNWDTVLTISVHILALRAIGDLWIEYGDVNTPDVGKREAVRMLRAGHVFDDTYIMPKICHCYKGPQTTLDHNAVRNGTYQQRDLTVARLP